ncbi:RsiV family protein [Bacteroides sp. OttesenSCG-928-D19]|nr:RsiV family protein [Bacteroides sp. OttesenSCG-928-D19]
MKKQCVSLLVLLLAAGFFFSSCGNKVKKPTGALEFDNIRYTEAVHLFGDTAKPGARLIIDYVYVAKANDDDLKQFLNNYFLTVCFDEKYRTLEAEDAIKRYAQIYTSEYRIDLEPMYLEDRKANNREDQETVASWYDYYQNIESHIQLYDGDLLIYRTEFNEFTGGAHGMERTNFLNIDLKNKHLLTLDDLFIEDSSEALTQLLWLQLMKNNSVNTQEELERMGYGLTGDLAPTENFYLDRTGITFYYNVYEIAPYVMGPIEIKLLYTTMEHLMKDVKILSALQRLS